MPTAFPANLLRPGLYLYEDVYFQGAILLPRGTEIQERHVRQIQAWGVGEIAVLGEVDDFAKVAREPGGPAATAAGAAPATAAPAATTVEARLPEGREEAGRYVVAGSLGPAPARAEYDGGFVVEGGVTGAYEIVATGPVEVKGEVLGGRIVSRAGDVTIGGPVRARAPVLIEGRDVRLGDVEGAEIVARRRIEATSLVAARAKAGEEILVTAGEGAIRGGVSTSNLRIRCGVAGSREGVATELVIPQNPDRIRYLKAQEIERALEGKRAEYGRLEKVIQVIRTLGDKVATLSPEKREELAVQTKRYLALQQELKRLESDLQMARAEAESDAVTMDRCPIVADQVFAGVRIAIGGASIQIGAKGEKVGYYFKNGRILVYVATH